MNETYIKTLIESFISNQVNKEYVKLYLKDSSIRKQCDEMISEYINNSILTDKGISDKCINYLNNVIKPQLKKKPYLLNLNVVKRTIEDYLIKLDNRFYNKKETTNYYDVKLYEIKCDRITYLLSKIDNEFSFRNNDILDAEERLASIYINRIKNNNTLSIEQVEELLSFTISGGFILKHDEYTEKAFDYALKMILNNDYRIDDYLYKTLFVNSCLNILKEKGINDIKFSFDCKDYEMSYLPSKKTISINEEELKNRTTIQNFIAFFHELRHYEQHNDLINNNLRKFLFDKETFLSEELREDKYYKKNYNNLFTEKDACYTSYEYLYNFINEKAPLKLSSAKKEIYRNLMIVILLSNENINERKNGNDTKDINVLFEETVRNKKTLLAFFKYYVNSPLIIEYDICGRKRSVFELLEDKEYYEKNGFLDRCEIINYLLYEESVTMDYITENLKLLDEKELKEQYSKYYKEARKVLKHKLIRYKADALADKKNKLNGNKLAFSDFYDMVIDKLRERNIRGLHKNKNIELYRKNEDELRIAYKWLYNFSKELSEERKKDEIDYKSK